MESLSGLAIALSIQEKSRVGIAHHLPTEKHLSTLQRGMNYRIIVMTSFQVTLFQN